MILLNCFYSVFTELKISHSLEDVLPNLLYFCKYINLVHTWTELYTAHSQILNIHICFVCKKVSVGHCSANWNLFNWPPWFMSSYRSFLVRETWCLWILNLDIWITLHNSFVLTLDGSLKLVFENVFKNILTSGKFYISAHWLWFLMLSYDINYSYWIIFMY